MRVRRQDTVATGLQRGCAWAARRRGAAENAAEEVGPSSCDIKAIANVQHTCRPRSSWHRPRPHPHLGTSTTMLTILQNNLRCRSQTTQSPQDLPSRHRRATMDQLASCCASGPETTCRTCAGSAADQEHLTDGQSLCSLSSPVRRY